MIATLSGMAKGCLSVSPIICHGAWAGRTCTSWGGLTGDAGGRRQAQPCEKLRPRQKLRPDYRRDQSTRNEEHFSGYTDRYRPKASAWRTRLQHCLIEHSVTTSFVRDTRARERQADFLAGQILEISDDGSTDYTQTEDHENPKSRAYPAVAPEG
jgi:hypothetical protein